LSVEATFGLGFCRQLDRRETRWGQFSTYSMLRQSRLILPKVV
jgi:hypothetical protein